MILSLLFSSVPGTLRWSALPAYAVLVMFSVALKSHPSLLVPFSDIVSGNEPAIAAVLATVLLWQFFSKAVTLREAAPKAKSLLTHHSPATLVDKIATALQLPPSEARIWRTAAHEAGHVLFFASLEHLPENLSVRIEINGLVYENGILGSISHSLPMEAMEDTEHHLVWHMLTSLGGLEAEHVLLGSRAPGGLDDQAQWLNRASEFLVNGLGDPFFLFALKKREIAVNSESLKRLKDSQQRIVRKFLICNRELLTALTDMLGARHVLDEDQLRPYLQRVILVSDIPRLSRLEKQPGTNGNV